MGLTALIPFWGRVTNKNTPLHYRANILRYEKTEAKALQFFFTANILFKRCIFILWSWWDSNPRPDKLAINFLHA